MYTKKLKQLRSTDLRDYICSFHGALQKYLNVQMYVVCKRKHSKPSGHIGIVNQEDRADEQKQTSCSSSSRQETSSPTPQFGCLVAFDVEKFSMHLHSHPKSYATTTVLGTPSERGSWLADVRIHPTSPTSRLVWFHVRRKKEVGRGMRTTCLI